MIIRTVLRVGLPPRWTVTVSRLLATAGMAASVALGADSAPTSAAQDTVLPQSLPGGVARQDMVRGWLEPQVASTWEAWKAGFESRMETGGWEERATKLRETLREAIGGLPPERTPLRAQTTGTLHRGGYRVEKVIFESLPGFHVTAALFLPHGASGRSPVPGVLIPCGHAGAAKAHGEYQAAGALLALNGMAALVIDPVDQGERFQRLDENGRPIVGGTAAHMQEGLAATLLGWNLIRSQVWDGMRAVDYLAARPEVDGARLGITGNSGGATQASLIFALDDRLSVAAASCYIHQLHYQAWHQVGDSEQQFFGQLAAGFEHAEFFLSRAPAPVLLLAGTHDFFAVEKTWETFRFLNRRYSDLGRSERVAMFENNAGHNYNRQQREAIVRWMARWLRNEDREVHEPDLALFSEEELWATPKGQTLLLPDARSLWDLYRDEAARLAERRGSPRGDELAGRIRRVTQVRTAPAEWGVTAATRRLFIENPDTVTEALVLEWGEAPLAVPLVVFQPRQPQAGPPIIVATDHPVGDLAHDPFPLAEWIGTGRTVVAFNPTGLGESQQIRQVSRGEVVATDINDALALYQLGSSQLKMQTEDVLRVAQFARDRGWASGGNVQLVGERGASIPVLHAAVLDRARVGAVHLRQPLHSWNNLLELERGYRVLASIVHGALREYDLPDLVAELGSKVRIQTPLNAIGVEMQDDDHALPAGFAEPVLVGLHGLYFGNTRFENAAGLETLPRLAARWENAVHQRGNDWAGEWRGFLLGPIDGVVEFEGVSDQQIEFEIDGQIVLPREAYPGSASSRLAMTRGRAYPVTLRYIQPSGGRGSFSIGWSWSGRPMSIIESDALRHSRELAHRAREILLR